MPKQDALDDDIQVEMPGLKVKSPATALKFFHGWSGVAVLLIGALLYGGWLHHKETTEGNQQIRDALAENTYVLSLPQAERERLNIAMPDSLRRKIRQGRE